MGQNIERTRAYVAGHALIVLGLAAAGSSCAQVQDTRTLEPAAGHSWNQTHRVDLPAGWSVTARNVGPADESTSLSGPDSMHCLVSTSPAEPKHYWAESPEKVSVQGQAASYGKRDPDFGPYPAQVVWETSDRWFAVSCDLDRAGIVDFAHRVRAEPNPMPVPFRLRSVPDGIHMTQLIESVDGKTTRVGAQFAYQGDGRPMTMQIGNQAKELLSGETVETQTINGRLVEVRRLSQSLCLRTESEPICVTGPADEPATDWSPSARRAAEETAAALDPVADSNDQTSWYDADDAFPR